MLFQNVSSSSRNLTVFSPISRRRHAWKAKEQWSIQKPCRKSKYCRNKISDMIELVGKEILKSWLFCSPCICGDEKARHASINLGNGAPGPGGHADGRVTAVSGGQQGWQGDSRTHSLLNLCLFGTLYLGSTNKSFLCGPSLLFSTCLHGILFGGVFNNIINNWLLFTSPLCCVSGDPMSIPVDHNLVWRMNVW